jgi:hypothetical protein
MQQGGAALRRECMKFDMRRRASCHQRSVMDNIQSKNRYGKTSHAELHMFAATVIELVEYEYIR